MKFTTYIIIILIVLPGILSAHNAYKLWLDYKPQSKQIIKTEYSFIKSWYLNRDYADDVVLQKVKELTSTITPVILNKPMPKSVKLLKSNQIRIILDSSLVELTSEGYQILSTDNQIDIKAFGSKGLLYGVLDVLNRMNSGQRIRNLNINNNPKLAVRILNHWDNLDRTVERGYAGFSIFNWHELPNVIEQRYHDYALANASIGINGTVLTNVNANALVLRTDYLYKVKALADVFRAYGLKVYLTARFSAPIELGGLATADPLDPMVRAWWNDKIEEIYQIIPDFGGFVVKANSEGQPGPQDYQRSHAQGANMLAEPLGRHDGIVMWRAFVYSHEVPEDRCKQAYNEFVPLDGQFAKNVMIQVKNGPLDFQPREPLHPLFGALQQTPIMLELQITKEYLGQGTHLVGLANMYEEVLQTDTYSQEGGSTVSEIIQGSITNKKLSGMAGVANIGTALNWTGNLFAQADWFAFGRLAWNPDMSPDSIFKEWSMLTFKNEKLSQIAIQLLDMSHEACVNYMTPLGLHHIMAEGHHYGPGPWVANLGREDWTSVYYHRATQDSIGFNRTDSGSKALSQYHPKYAAQFSNLNTCPETYLLWFHRISWDHEMKSGRSFWEELVSKYDEGVKSAEQMNEIWKQAENFIDASSFEHVRAHLEIQLLEAKWWREACLTYFQSINGLDYPEFTEKPKQSLSFYQSLRFPYSPGIRPKW